MELVGESFNLLNRGNRRVLITEDGFQSNSASFSGQISALESITFQHNTVFQTTFFTLLTLTLRGKCSWR